MRLFLRRSPTLVVWLCLLMPVPAFAGNPLLKMAPAPIVPLLDTRHYLLPPDLACEINIIGDLNERELAGGKRIRPLLVFLAASLAGVPLETVMPVARALEWTHTGSLIHDDILDDDLDRRGVPTMLGRGYRTKTAVLTGDFLIISAQLEIAKLANNRFGPDFSAAVLQLPLGEMYQDQVRKNGRYTEAEWEKIAAYKTGALFGWAMKAPFLIAGADELANLANDVGYRLGALYQLWDDIGDARAEAKRGEINYVLRLAGERANVSPFSKEFPEAALAEAEHAARERFQSERERLVEDIARLYDGARERSPDPARAAAARRTLLDFLDFLNLKLPR